MKKTEQYIYINRNLSLALLKMLTKLNRIELLEKTHKIYYNIFYFMTISEYYYFNYPHHLQTHNHCHQHGWYQN